jgi:hypothetical protein
VVVLDIQIAGLECCRSGCEIYRDCVFGNWNRPEQSTFSDPRIEIVNLLTSRASEYVKSYEGEGTVVIAPVLTDEFAAHEAHVGFKREVLWCFTCDGVCPHPSGCSPTHEAIEISDRGRLDTWSWKEDVKQWARRTK